MMKKEGKSKASTILPVPRTKKEAKQFYDRISRFYDLTGAIERKYAQRALDYLSIRQRETVLEIGFGTGYCLQRMAEQVGPMGRACGIDISSGMLQLATRRLEKAGLLDRTELCCGDAAFLPYREDTFNAPFMSFTLELFDTPEIPIVLEEVKRV
ncbi:class I SAM-dependent methyltransferase, partial [Chloroflexota bacterium]